MYFPAIPTEGKNHQEFREAANKRFTTSKSAIAALRRIGKPRLGGFYVWSDPDREIGTVFNVILSLAKNLRTRPRNEWQSPVDLIFDNWLDLLYPWFLHLMEDLILGGSDPTTPTGLYVYDGALSMIPYFCSLPDPEIDRVIIRIVGTTPRFGSLATKVLLKTLDRNHFAWRFWAILMARLVSHHQTNPEKPKLEMNVFENLKSARAVFIRHLYRELLRVHTMDHEELLGLNSVLFLYRVKPHGEGKEPLTADEVDQRHALRVLVRLLSSFLRMRKKSMVKLKEETAMWLMQLIDVTMDGNLLVEEAVDAGLVVALLKAHPFYFSNYHSQLPTSFAESAARLLSEIAKFFGFPSVLHRFLQSVKVISRSEFYEERLRRNSKLMWRIWEQVITKATLFRAMRSSLKAAGDFWRCDNLSSAITRMWDDLTLNFVVVPDAQEHFTVPSPAKGFTGMLDIKKIVQECVISETRESQAW
ncbi:hypothetical protein L218DRAFT_961036 [Marasmius fiardii PR-910]|nr:hypothetical protein L218DRAFT_961036 [Marasmius fiardii PR-910]